jgi:hypothetical protein
MSKKTRWKIRVSKTASGLTIRLLDLGKMISTIERGPATNLRPAGAHKDKRRKTRAEQLRQELQDE